MNYLLDTHLLLWSAGWDQADPKGSGLSATAARLIADTSHTIYFSAASIWEIAIKASLGREDFKVDPGLIRRGLLENAYSELPVTSEHAAAVCRLPALHKDPFDRLLIAQAQVEGLMLLTSDATVARYPGSIQRV